MTTEPNQLREERAGATNTFQTSPEMAGKTPTSASTATEQHQPSSDEDVPSNSDDRYKKHRWKFLLLGAVSGPLMGMYSVGAAPGSWIGDLIGGVVLWYLIWCLWAWSKRRSDRSQAKR